MIGLCFQMSPSGHHSLSEFARVCESNFSNSMVSTSLMASKVTFNYQGNYCIEFVRDQLLRQQKDKPQTRGCKVALHRMHLNAFQCEQEAEVPQQVCCLKRKNISMDRTSIKMGEEIRRVVISYIRKCISLDRNIISI